MLKKLNSIYGSCTDWVAITLYDGKENFIFKWSNGIEQEQTTLLWDISQPRNMLLTI